ncbi:hypothetical protein J2Z62_000723 [Mycoplasmoides fastidiosum]|uniref:Peptide ABC transporter substrate-binding protein n=1 Tax=Mycoplasmoides fastidiosum TaxID=92758 RepID=A0ABU0M006_9BACT|nr:hypothetical protein [Mycoplasmoides fastidiosum]MDQ0514285.1 hypothetical protein [Mycoplasmoides fastidiosum]UUD38108.1 hypothetical protein NPA10_01850 [Mycoplasmoides fastidiosum]
MKFNYLITRTRSRMFQTSLLTGLTTGLFLAACSGANLPYERNEYRTKSNLAARDIRLDAFRHDYTVQANGKSKISNDLSAALIDYEYTGRTDLNQDGQVINNQYTKYRIRFGLADAIYLTLPNQAEPVVFDSDAADDFMIDDPVFLGVKILRSNNPRSVNSAAFDQALNTATKVQFTVRENAYWINARGEQTAYQVIPEDFYAKYARTILSDGAYRHQHGGSAAADQFAIDQTYQGRLAANNRFGPQSSYASEYLLKLFDVDTDKLRDLTTFLTNVQVGNQTKKAVTFHSLASVARADFKNVFAKTVFNANFFTAAPSQYIKDHQDRNPTGVSGLAAESGYYWYGADYEDMLYSGPYYVQESSRSAEIYAINPHFYDQAWVHANDTLRLLVTENDSSDPLAFQNNQFEEYKQGAVAQIDFAALTPVQKNQVGLNQKDFNLQYQKLADYDYTGTGLITWKPIVYSDLTNAETLRTNYAFNDAFSLLMYGVNIADLEAGKQNLSHYWTGDGYLLRSLLSTAFNYFAFNNEININTSFWGTIARPDGLINGTDQATAPFKKLSEAPNQYSFFFYGGADQQTRFEKTLAEDQARFQNNQTNQTVAYQANNYEQLQTEMERLLDQFYDSATGLGRNLKTDPVNNKIQFTFYDRMRNAPPARRSATQNALNAINALDRKHRLALVQAPLTVQNDAIVTLGRTANAYSSWYYDLDSYGGFLQYFLYVNKNNPLFTALFQFDPADQTAIKAVKPNLLTRFDQFPEFSKFAQAFKASTTVFPRTNLQDYSSYNKMKNGTNQDWAEANEFMRAVVNPNYDPVLALSKFGLEYSRTLTNLQSATLNQEITSLVGFSLNSATGYQLVNKPIPILINQHYSIPVSVESGVVALRYVTVHK